MLEDHIYRETADLGHASANSVDSTVARTETLHSQGKMLLFFAALARKYQASDPRDKIFGLKELDTRLDNG